MILTPRIAHQSVILLWVLNRDKTRWVAISCVVCHYAEVLIMSLNCLLSDILPNLSCRETMCHFGFCSSQWNASDPNKMRHIKLWWRSYVFKLHTVIWSPDFVIVATLSVVFFSLKDEHIPRQCSFIDSNKICRGENSVASNSTILTKNRVFNRLLLYPTRRFSEPRHFVANMRHFFMKPDHVMDTVRDQSH